MISVIIPTYKNKSLFLKNLQHNLQFLKDEEVIVVNDNPGTSLKKDLAEFKNIVLIENKKNYGFGKSINIGIRVAKNRLVMLLNSDVLLQDSKYGLAVDNLEKDRSLFAVGFAQKEKDGRVVGRNKFFWKNGLFFHQGKVSIEDGRNGWAEGGSCLLDRDKFLTLSGFDPLYAPFYWEDIDLSYRAWKSGYKVMFNPKIVVEHHHETTIGKYFPGKFIRTIAFRNQFLFIWKNITDPGLVINHFLFLPFNIVYYSFKKEWCFIAGLVAAVRRIGMIKRQSYKIDDKMIVNLFFHE